MTVHAKLDHPEPRHSSDYNVVAVGSSAGGLRSLSALLAPLPAEFRCAVVVAPHLFRGHRSMMADLLDRKTNLPVRQAHDGDAIVPGVALIAVPDLHMLADCGGIVRLLDSPAVHHLRPSIDLLFESVAVHYRQRAIGVILSGSGRDGAEGIRAIKQAGGVTLAEDPDQAEFSSMPTAAIATGCVDFVLPAHDLALTLLQLSLAHTSHD